MLILFSFLHQVGFKINNEKLTKCCPSRKAFRTSMQQVGAETLVEIRKKCKDKMLHHACDAAIKGGHHHMVKRCLGVPMKSVS